MYKHDDAVKRGLLFGQVEILFIKAAQAGASVNLLHYCGDSVDLPWRCCEIAVELMELVEVILMEILFWSEVRYSVDYDIRRWNYLSRSREARLPRWRIAFKMHLNVTALRAFRVFTARHAHSACYNFE